MGKYGLLMTVLQGNLGKDPEIKYLPDGTAVTSFSLAVTLRKGKDQEKTRWVRISAWRALAEMLAQTLSKGDNVTITGYDLDTSHWIAKDGTAASQLEMTVDKIVFNRVAKWADGTGAEYQSGEDGPVAAPEEDDVPF